MLTNPLMEKFPKAMAQSLMSYANLKYDNTREGNNGICLNCNQLVICSNPNCYYNHTKSKTNNDRIKAIRIKLESSIVSYVVEGGCLQGNKNFS